MAKILTVIDPQKWELVRYAIWSILNVELNNQYQLTYDRDIDLEVMMEASNPVDKIQPPVVNVSLASGDWGNKQQGQVDGTYQFNIDAYTNSKTNESERGDAKAAMRLQRILGLCRSILENQAYKTLGFAPGFVMRTSCGSMNIAQPNKEDATNAMMGRIVFTVLANERTDLKQANLIECYETIIKLGATNQGYLIRGENY